LDALQIACSRPEFQKDLDSLHKSGGITFQLGLAQLMGRATTTATKELSLDGYDMGKIKEFVKQHAGVLAVR